MRRRLFLTGGLSALAGCSERGADRRSWEPRYRISVRVSLDGRTQSGSSTFRSVYRRTDDGERGLPGARLAARTWGEAIAVPMGGKAYLVGALGSVFGVDTDRQLSLRGARVLTSLLPAQQANDFDALASGELYRRLRELEGEHPAPASLWPIFLAFSDIEDLSTVRFVTVPGARYSVGVNVASMSLETAFGRGTQMEQVAIEMTRDAATRRLHTLAPWLADLRDRESRLHTRRDGMPLAETLTYRNFVLTGDDD